MMSRLLALIRRRVRFGLLLLLFIIGVLAQQATLPVMEGFDESLHYNYAVWLRTEHSLPDRATDRTNGPRQESSQPPLTYWIYATTLNLLNAPFNPDDTPAVWGQARNLWFAAPDQWRRRDNANGYYHNLANDDLWEHPDIAVADRGARLASLLLGLVAVIGAYGCACEVFRREVWILTATALFAFMPQLIHLSAIVSNDIGTTAFATLAVWQTLRILRKGASPVQLMLLGILLGMTGLSKVNALLIAPGIGIAVWFDARNHRLSLKGLIANGLWVAIPFVMIFGPWVWYGWTNYHSPLGLEAHTVFENSKVVPTVPQFIAGIVPVLASYVGRFDAGSTLMHPAVYGLFAILVGLTIAGYATLFRSRQRYSRFERQQFIVLAVVALAVFLGLLYWLYRLFAIALNIQARLMYPGHIAVVLLVTGGLSALDQHLRCRYSRALRTYSIGLTTAAGILLTPLILFATYAPPSLLTRAQLPRLQGTPIDYDHTIRFLGYSQTTPLLTAGGLHTITLCWEVLHPTSREAVVAVKLLDGSQIIADRTSIPGLGHFNSSLWHTGDIFCDDTDIPLPATLTPAHVYDVLLVILDWQATTLDGTPISLPRIVQVVSPAGDMRATVNANWQNLGVSFPDFADLRDVAVIGTPAPGAMLHLGLLWSVHAPTQGGYSQFLHLIGPNAAVSLADSPPLAGHYPTWAWSAGEHIVDQWAFTLPDALSPGTYKLELGFYLQNSGDRLPVTLNGQTVKDGSVTIDTFEIK